MTKTLTRHGNSLALVIDKPILQLLNIDEHTKLEIVTDGVRLMIIPQANATHQAKVAALITDKTARREQMDQWLKKEDKRYSKVYKALSKPS